MKKAAAFLIIVIKKAKDNNLIDIANAMTFKIIIAIFPFIIFLMTLMGFFNLEIGNFIGKMTRGMPDIVMQILNVFVSEVVNKKRPSLLSSSLLISIISASSGFNSIIRGLNRVYKQKETRGFIKVRMISILSVFLFAVFIISMLLLFIFGDAIKDILIKYKLINNIPNIIGNFAVTMITLFLSFVMIIIIYKISICKKICFFELVPGAFSTVIIWIVLSKGFNIYVNNFSRYSKVYGGIGSIIIFFIWINLISLSLLLGGQINAAISLMSGKN